MPGHEGTETANLPKRFARAARPASPASSAMVRPGRPIVPAGGTDDQFERFARAEGACPDSPGRSSPAPRW